MSLNNNMKELNYNPLMFFFSDFKVGYTIKWTDFFFGIRISLLLSFISQQGSVPEPPPPPAFLISI